jgi:hypothetical protein
MVHSQVACEGRHHRAITFTFTKKRSLHALNYGFIPWALSCKSWSEIPPLWGDTNYAGYPINCA